MNRFQRSRRVVISISVTALHSIDHSALKRLTSRTVAGTGAESFGYDAIGRLVSHASELGAFTLGYLGETSQITQRQLASSVLATTWGYLPNSGDRRLASIGNTGLAAGQFSNFSVDHRR